MIVLQAHQLVKSYGVDLIFEDVSFIVKAGAKVALVGPNGAGKSTLLKCLIDIEKLDGGTVTWGKGTSWGYLAQSTEGLDDNLKVIDLMLEAYSDLIDLREQLQETELAMGNPVIYQDEGRLPQVMEKYAKLTARYEIEGGYTFETRIKEVLSGLGFQKEDWERKLDTFSGGQKTRLFLAKLLLREPDLILLDEPTNYLDLKALEWLESFLKQYPGAVLIVSHDRYFLDAVVAEVFELDRGSLQVFTGNYSKYALKKAQQQEALARAYELQQIRIRRLEEYVARYRAGIKAKQARGRETRLAKMILSDKPDSKEKVNLRLNPVSSTGDLVLEVQHLSSGYPGCLVLNDLNFKIRRGEKVALIGANGTGKTTLLKNILGLLPWNQGSIRFGSRVKTAYFAQEHETLRGRHTVMEEILADFDLTYEEVRSALARFLFRGDDLGKKVSSLSGGEESRLMLAKLMLTQANLLILDEPTNHLDMETRQVLEDALAEFPGTIFFVSHDRYFINQVANRLIELESQRIVEYLGDYDYYRWKKEEQRQREQEKLAFLKKNQSEVRPKTAAKETKKAETLNTEAIEQQILVLESRLEDLAEALGKQELYTNPELVKSKREEYSNLEQQLEELYASWEDALNRQGYN